MNELHIKFFQKTALWLLPIYSSNKPIKKLVDLPSYGNATIGKKLSHGQYIFSGVQFDLDVDNPWLIEPPSPDVERDLYGFFWLNDLASCGNSKARHCAREWIKKWCSYNSRYKRSGWKADITALRCINLLRNWSFVNENLTNNSELYVKYLWQQFKYLVFMVRIYPNGLKKIKVTYALFLLAAAFDIPTRKKKKFLKQLSKALLKVVSLDGKISSRNPEEFLECFIMLMEILKVNKSENFLNRREYNVLYELKMIMAPILRGLRLGNGSLTRTHGGDVGSSELIDKYLVKSNVKAPAALNNILGFERITAGRLVLIVDCAPPDFSIDADNPHASCLSFELSSGQRPIFINCGPGGRFGSAFKRYCQSTQAHNSCTLGDISQSEYEFISRQKRWPKETIKYGPKNVTVSRDKTLEATWLDLCHDSYQKKYGYLHKRKLLVLNCGKVFTGTDTFEISKEKDNKLKEIDKFYAHFQLHPDVELWDHPRLQTIILRLKNGEHWIFESDLGAISIEESTFINSHLSNPQNTKRIVIKSSTLLNKTEIKWSLRRREIVNRNTRDADLLN